MRYDYETDEEAFPHDAYEADGWGHGIAWYVLGWQVEANEETEWTGLLSRTGMVVAKMVGDDRHFLFEPGDLTPIDPESFCRTCGQIGCTHNAYA